MGNQVVQQIKIFVGLESDADGMEKRVNDWIRASKVRVLQITGNIAPQTESGKLGGGLSGGGSASDVMLVILYEVATS